MRKTVASVAVWLTMIANSHAQTVNANEPDPAVWIKSIYDLYKRAEDDMKLMREANYRLVEKRADKNLAALFRKDAACMKKNGGAPCTFEADFIINGQDYQLGNVQVLPAVMKGDKATVTVRFENARVPNTNQFEFVKENGAWKVADVTMRSGKVNPSRLSAMMKRDAR